MHTTSPANWAMLLILPAGDVLSINGNSGSAGDTGYAGYPVNGKRP